MRLSTLLVALTVLATALAAALPTLSAEAPTSCRPGNVFQNEDVRVWFHGAKGFVKVFDTNGSEDGNGGPHFDYKTGEIVELGADNATLARMDLERAFPQTSGCAIEETEEWVNMTLTVTDDVKADGKVGEATVVFAYHFNKTSQGAKFDLEVLDWPWQSEESELAYAFDVHASEGSLTPAENGIGWSDADGNARGYMEWAANATASYADGHNETAIVDGETTMDGTQNARVALRFTNVTAGYEHLVYDPWAGIGAWIVVGPLLVGLAPVEALLPANVLAAVRKLL